MKIKCSLKYVKHAIIQIIKRFCLKFDVNNIGID